MPRTFFFVSSSNAGFHTGILKERIALRSGDPQRSAIFFFGPRSDFFAGPQSPLQSKRIRVPKREEREREGERELSLSLSLPLSFLSFWYAEDIGEKNGRNVKMENVSNANAHFWTLSSFVCCRWCWCSSRRTHIWVSSFVWLLFFGVCFFG